MHATLTLSQLTRTMTTPIGCYRLHQPLPFHGGQEAELTRHSSTGALPMLKAVHHSDFCDKHANCQGC